MVNETRIGGYIVSDDGVAIHVRLPSSRVVFIEGDNYRALDNKVYAALRVGIDAAVDALGAFLEKQGIKNL